MTWSRFQTGQAPERPRHIRGPLPLLRSRPGGIRSLAIARRPEPDKTRGQRSEVRDRTALGLCTANVRLVISDICPGGEGGIRTHGTVSRTQHFQCCQLSHSCTSPPKGNSNCEFRDSLWRRGWDSNPRYPYGYNGFRDRPIQPLSHLSTPDSGFRRSRKKDCIIARQSPSRIPPSTFTR